MDAEGQAVRPGEARALQEAVRRARLIEAERTDVIIELKAAEAARLETLLDALAPLFAQVPADALQFDLALQRGSEPRLWIDMVAFVVMSRDRQTYRFLQDTQNGRRILFESRDVPAIVEKVTDYLALRLVEREKALAAVEAVPVTAAVAPAARSEAAPMPTPPSAPSARGGAGGAGWFLVGTVVGAAGLFAIGWLATLPG